MPVIRLETTINAPIQVCFDLSRSIDLHTVSTEQTGETAIAGVTSGLINLGQTVTWRAKHFGIWQTLTSKITEFNEPYFFVDEMVNGAFQGFRHEHHFTDVRGQTLITDIFNYISPFGPIGRLADILFLKKYMTNLLTIRNNVVKIYAESGNYSLYLKNE